MTTRELIARLQELDPSGDLVVTERRCSDNGPMDLSDWTLEEFYPQNGGAWYTTTDYRLKEDSSRTPVRAVHYNGN